MTQTTTIKSDDRRMIITVRLTADRFRPTVQQDDRDDYEAYAALYAVQEAISSLWVVGELYQILVHEYVGPNRSGDRQPRYSLRPDNGGWGGNSDHTVKRYNGWRGTTDDWSARGHGLRNLVSVTVTGTRSKCVRIVLGPNLRPSE